MSMAARFFLSTSELTSASFTMRSTSSLPSTLAPAQQHLPQWMRFADLAGSAELRVRHDHAHELVPIPP